MSTFTKKVQDNEGRLQALAAKLSLDSAYGQHLVIEEGMKMLVQHALYRMQGEIELLQLTIKRREIIQRVSG